MSSSRSTDEAAAQTIDAKKQQLNQWGYMYAELALYSDHGIGLLYDCGQEIELDEPAQATMRAQMMQKIATEMRQVTESIKRVDEASAADAYKRKDDPATPSAQEQNPRLTAQVKSYFNADCGLTVTQQYQCLTDPAFRPPVQVVQPVYDAAPPRPSFFKRNPGVRDALIGLGIGVLGLAVAAGIAFGIAFTGGAIIPALGAAFAGGFGLVGTLTAQGLTTGAALGVVYGGAGVAVGLSSGLVAGVGGVVRVIGRLIQRGRDKKNQAHQSVVDGDDVLDLGDDPNVGNTPAPSRPSSRCGSTSNVQAALSRRSSVSGESNVIDPAAPSAAGTSERSDDPVEPTRTYVDVARGAGQAVTDAAVTVVSTTAYGVGMGARLAANAPGAVAGAAVAATNAVTGSVTAVGSTLWNAVPSIRRSSGGVEQAPVVDDSAATKTNGNPFA